MSGGEGPAQDFEGREATFFEEDALPAAAFAQEVKAQLAEQGFLAREDVEVVVSGGGEGGDLSLLEALQPLLQGAQGFIIAVLSVDEVPWDGQEIDLFFDGGGDDLSPDKGDCELRVVQGDAGGSSAEVEIADAEDFEVESVHGARSIKGCGRVPIVVVIAEVVRSSEMARIVGSGRSDLLYGEDHQWKNLNAIFFRRANHG